MAMENRPFMDDFSIKTSIHRGFSSQPCLITRGGSNPLIKVDIKNWKDPPDFMGKLAIYLFMAIFEFAMSQITIW